LYQQVESDENTDDDDDDGVGCKTSRQAPAVFDDIVWAFSQRVSQSQWHHTWKIKINDMPCCFCAAMDGGM